MKRNHYLVLAGALSTSVLLAGCGSSSSSGSGSTEDTQVSGTATAPAGTVAFYEPRTPFEVALNFLVPPVAAAITGLDPIEGADVELIRVDDDGNQIGEVLARTSTSITGDYRLTLPEGVNLAGNLVVRITGQNSTTLRAQVVEQDVDISPVSEFVLRKFISQGAKLDQLVVTDVVKLEGRVEAFDITLSDANNLEQAFAALDQQVGDFVENQVAVVAGGEGDSTGIAGNYRSAAFEFGLHDNDDGSNGTYATDLWMAQFSFGAGSDGAVTVNHTQEDFAYGSLNGSALNQSGVYYEVGLDSFDESFAATYTGNGILSITGEFEEEIDGDYGWRFPAFTYNLQQVPDTGLFFLLANEAAVRYSTVDTNGDGEKDAVDPQAKQGDEVFRSLEVFSRTPTAFTDSDLTGTFGRVFIETWIESGVLEVETEINTLTFPGDGTENVGASAGHRIGLEAGNPAPTYTAVSGPAENGLTMVISADGDIVSVGGEATDGFVNDDANFLAFAESEGTDDLNAQMNKTLAVKLPAQAPTVAGKTYRLLFNSLTLGNGEEMIMNSSKFNTLLSMASNTTGSIDGTFFEVIKAGLGGDIEVSTEEVADIEVAVSLGGSEPTDLVVSDEEGTTTLEGFFNEDASLGIFNVRWQPTGPGNPNELGLAILVEIDG
ncbi:hypothetical protein [Marinobacter sp.]|uniref:hypothetical protein n=1 Tax=Marinobacter sp. TaxID=50741 RepID=UPI0035C6B0B0